MKKAILGLFLFFLAGTLSAGSSVFPPDPAALEASDCGYSLIKVNSEIHNCLRVIVRFRVRDLGYKTLIKADGRGGHPLIRRHLNRVTVELLNIEFPETEPQQEWARTYVQASANDLDLFAFSTDRIPDPTFKWKHNTFTDDARLKGFVSLYRKDRTRIFRGLLTIAQRSIGGPLELDKDGNYKKFHDGVESFATLTNVCLDTNK